MTKIDIYTLKGVKSGTMSLPKEYVEAPVGLLAQAIRVYQEREHVGLRQAKTRSEVNRTTKKVYKQKGTGGARHGSRRANVFVGGGVTFGPRAERRILTLPDKLKIKAKGGAFVSKAQDGGIIGVEGISKVEKTKAVGEFMGKITKELKSKKFTFVISDKNKAVLRFLKNLGAAEAYLFSDVNAYNILKSDLLVLDQDIFGAVKEKEVTKKTVKEGAKVK
jgi:large subunit ribosomal protein L4